MHLKAVDEPSQGRQVSDDMTLGFARTALCKDVTYGTILAKAGIYDEATSLKCPFQNGLEKCPVANLGNWS